MTRTGIAATIVTAALASSSVLAAQGGGAGTAAETDACFYKAVNMAAKQADNAMVLMPGKVLKAFLATCEKQTGVEGIKYRSIRDLKDDDMIPTMSTPQAEPKDLIIE